MELLTRRGCEMGWGNRKRRKYDGNRQWNVVRQTCRPTKPPPHHPAQHAGSHSSLSSYPRSFYSCFHLRKFKAILSLSYLCCWFLSGVPLFARLLTKGGEISCASPLRGYFPLHASPPKNQNPECFWLLDPRRGKGKMHLSLKKSSCEIWPGFLCAPARRGTVQEPVKCTCLSNRVQTGAMSGPLLFRPPFPLSQTHSILTFCDPKIPANG